MNITLTINNRSFGDRLSTYEVDKEVTYKRVTTTIAGREIVKNKRVRPIVIFSLLPYTDSTAAADYNVLKSSTLTVTFTDPDTGNTLTKDMRIDSDLSHIFMLDSVDGNRYYKGGLITLRSNDVI